jgi:hypothetical protein
MIDQLVLRPGVHVAGMLFIGRSCAGYLSRRTVRVEHRISGLVYIPAPPDKAIHLPGDLVGEIAGPASATEMRLDKTRNEFFGARTASHSIHDVEDYFKKLHRFTMIDQANQITCPIHQRLRR